MITDEIRAELFAAQDTKYRDFQAKLIPGADPSSVIGVRTPEVRKIAKRLIRREDAEEFLDEISKRKWIKIEHVAGPGKAGSERKNGTEK